MLQFDNVSLRRGPHLLFERATLQIHPGQKVGLTGANGTGKSSLFEMILGHLTSESGEIKRPAGWEIAHVAQEMPATTQAAIEFVLDGDGGLRQLQQWLADAEAGGDGGPGPARREAQSLSPRHTVIARYPAGERSA